MKRQTSRRPTRLLALMLAFGFVSGLPLALSGFTLQQWLTEGHATLALIGLTANIGLPYTFKFLWAPVLDQVRPPGGFGRFGRRRGWLLLVQPLLALACVAFAACDASRAAGWAIAAAGAIAFCSATQDIAIDAWRIETFEIDMQGAANAVYVWGYRVGMLVSNAGVLLAVGYVGWHGALSIIAAIAVLCIGVTLLAPEPVVALPYDEPGRALARVGRAVTGSLTEFLARRGAWAILGYVALFYLGEAMAGTMLAPLYQHLGFDRRAVAAAVGFYPLFATMAGIGLGGLLVARLGLARGLISTGFFQMAAMAMYVWLTLSPGDHAVLYATVVTEAFAGGLATAAFLAYLSGLTSPAHTATQFALLTSVAPLASRTVGGFSGFLVTAVGWPAFYTLAMLASLPAMLLMLVILRRYPPQRAELTEPAARPTLPPSEGCPGKG